MAFTSSRLQYFGLAKQSVQGTAVSPTVFPRWLDGTMLDPDARFEEINEGDGSPDYSLVFKSKQLWKGKLVCYPRPQELGYLLQMWFGAASDTITGMSNPYTHTFAPKTTPSYYTVEWGQNDTALAASSAIINRVTDCIATQLEIESESNKPLKVTLDLVGRTAVRQTSRASVSLETGDCFKFASGLLKTGATLGGASDNAANIAKFKLTLSRGVDDDIMTNSINPKDFIWTTRKMNIEYEMLFSSNAHFNAVYFGGSSGTTDSIANSQGAIDFTFYQGGDSGDTDTFQFQLPAVVWQGKPVPAKLDGKAFRQECVGLVITPSSGEIITGVLTNAKSAAY